ncbi:MAG: EamA/RhaT family transporter [Candidatus Sedimenticola endophacoides]|uniref:EamA/RhaT family transporter n=1 Tax=Candidatus Sedimenticola endophacoides TaxID=2548426 RepID=A0A6N4E0C3_9GAMM|nr:MAG: EamA/RhaT family transporter [Candidatus Sedimenticola endophacoides]PUE03117.1 MAG: EamA/RhaT family transporter [Candidatus Sedimenticola endophacoides]PUE03176.1 MAG: EamA/RhaT family transporter [Candidatus Sedimenticola endophacoides]
MRREWGLIRAHLPRLALLALLGVALFNTCVYIGLQSTTAINALLINSAIPVWIMLLAMSFIREPVTGRNLAGVLFSLCGVVYLIVRGELGLLLRLDPNTGDLWILAATLAWAVYSLLLRRWKPAALSPISFLTFTMLVGVALLGALHWSGVTGEAPIIWGRGELISIGYFALFPSLVSFICWNEGVVRVGAPTAGHFIHLMPLFGTLLSVLLLGERVLPYHLVGAALIGTGILVSLKRS